MKFQSYEHSVEMIAMNLGCESCEDPMLLQRETTGGILQSYSLRLVFKDICLSQIISITNNTESIKSKIFIYNQNSLERGCFVM